MACSVPGVAIRESPVNLDPSTVAKASAAVLALLTLLRAGWKMVHGRRLVSAASEGIRLKAAAWLKRALAHFVLKALRRRWTLHYSLDIYLDSLHRRHEKLIVPGLVELPIDRCYIPLELRAGPTIEARDLLSRSGSMLLLGDPGSGKSALLSRIIRDLRVRARSDKERFRIPIYAPLKEVSSVIRESPGALETPNDAFRVLERWFEQNALVPAELFDSGGMLRSLASDPRNGVVVLFDGLDEVDSEDIDSVTGFLINLDRYLSAARAANLLIIAGRRQVLAFAPALTDGSLPRLVTMELKPFTPAAIYTFLLRWPYPPGSRNVEEARRIFGQLRLNPTLVEACSNPLALALYVNHDQRLRALGPSGGHSQPDTRAAFFGEVIDYLMIRTRNAEPGSRSPYRPFRQARTNFFVAVVDDHIRSPDKFNTIAHAKMLEHATVLAKEGQSAERALFDLAKDTGIVVRDDAAGTWSFVHRSFLDYFLAHSLAAIGKVREIETLLVQPLHTKPLRYLEGFYFACGLMASRNVPHLQTVLTQVGRSAFVGRYYPRAMLEAQAYFMPGFVDQIKFYCSMWHGRDQARDPDAVILFRDLVAVLADYERACAALGRKPEVTVLGELAAHFRSGGLSALQAANLDVELAMRIANEDHLPEVLLKSEVEDAVVALFEPTVADRIRPADLEQNPKLSAIIAETALRSPLLAYSLAAGGDRRTLLERPAFCFPDEHWADAWPIRGTRFAAVLATALPYVRDPANDPASFPHLAALARTRPLRRLRNELLFGYGPTATVVVSTIVLAVLGTMLLGAGGAWPLVVGGLCFAAVLAALRLLAVRGILEPPSCRVLGLRSAPESSPAVSDHRMRIVCGAPSRLRKFALRAPRGTEGTVYAVYARRLPLLWQRFCPSLEEDRLSLAHGAGVQEMWTEDVRKVMRGSRG